MAQFDCLRCGTAMCFVGQEKLQLGQTSWLLGDWPNLVAGALKVSIMVTIPNVPCAAIPTGRRMNFKANKTISE